jgi:hypothetical protein
VTRVTEHTAHLTLVEVLDDFQRRGFTEDFLLDDNGSLCCRGCGCCRPPEAVDLDGLVRVEGASDPADMAAVLALTCPACGRHGTAVVRFGPEAGPGDAAFLVAHDQRSSSTRPSVEPDRTDG